MRIAIFTEVMSPYVCGISSYVDVLRKGLAAIGHDVLVITSSLHTDQAFLKGGIVRCPAKKSKNKYGFECKNIDDKYVLKYIMRFKPDLVHIQTDTRIGYMGLEVADKLNIPVVFSVHDYYLDRFASDKSKLIWNFRTYFEKKHFCDMIDNAQVIISSNKRASVFIHEAGRDRKVWLVPSATDKKRFDYRRSSPEANAKLREKLGLPLDGIVAVFAGELSVDKNLEFVLTAFSRNIRKSDNIHFLIVGDGSEYEYLRSLCTKLRINDRVHFTGKVAHSIMPEIYAACDVYVCSSDDGLMSMSFVEAMSCGLPVLVKEDKEKYVYNMINDGVNGFTYKSTGDFAGYLRKIASFGSAKIERMKHIVRSSMKKIDAEYMASCTEKAYRRAAEVYRTDNQPT